MMSVFNNIVFNASLEWRTTRSLTIMPSFKLLSIFFNQLNSKLHDYLSIMTVEDDFDNHANDDDDGDNNLHK